MGHYDAARKRLKEETVQCILRLKVKSPARSTNARACAQNNPQNNNSSATGNGNKSPNQKSPQKQAKRRKPQSDRKALDTESILDQWFEEHTERPYPNKKQKEDLQNVVTSLLNRSPLGSTTNVIVPTVPRLRKERERERNENNLHVLLFYFL